MQLKTRIQKLEKFHKKNTLPEIDVQIGSIEVLKNGNIFTFLMSEENELSVEVETLTDREERIKSGDLKLIRISAGEEEETEEKETERAYLERVSEQNILFLEKMYGLSDEEVMRLLAELKPGDKKIIIEGSEI